jgi:hypothetical protein
MIDLTKPIRRKGYGKFIGDYAHTATPGAWLVADGSNSLRSGHFVMQSELERDYENIPEPRKPREWLITSLNLTTGEYSAIAVGHVHQWGGYKTRVIEWPHDAELPEWPQP